MRADSVPRDGEVRTSPAAVVVDEDEAQFQAEQENAELASRRRDAAAERDRAAAHREAAAADRDQSQAEADQRTQTRGRAADDREHAASSRDADASDRDKSHAESDQRAGKRDREHAASDRQLTASDRGHAQADANERTSDRGHAADDRARAAADRVNAVADRVAGDRDHDHTRAELRLAQLDHLTGAFGRGIGMRLLRREIIRARRGNGLLVLAYVDVDGLKIVNDRDGHAAGDVLLRQVADAIQQHLREYDTLVRVGGDEFICALGDCTPNVAHDRFRDIRATLAHTGTPASISVGYAELTPDDTLEQLTKRGDLDLYAAKRSR